MDTLYRIETPEGIALELQLAGPVVRSAAWLIDSAIRLALYTPFVIVAVFLDKMGLGLLMIALFLIEWFYPVIFELLWGATPGKRLLGLKVVQSNGTPISWQASMIRNLLRAVDFLPLFYAFGLIAMLCNVRFQRLGDLAAGTLVVHAHQQSSVLTIPEVEALQPPVPLSLQQRQAILAFAERYPTLSTARATELASLLNRWQAQPNNDPIQQVLAYARWYADSGQAR